MICIQSVEKAILNVKGVKSVSVSLENEEALVEGEASREDICKAIADIGYTCY